MLWPVTSNPISPQPFETLHIAEVLYEFDGPKIFTTLGSDSLLRFWYESEEDREEKLIRYLVTPTSPSLIQQLKTGHKTVHDLLKQSWLWVVDMHYDMSPAMAWSLESLDDVPLQFKPEPHATLCPEHMPLLSYRLIGPGLKEGAVPASVIARAVNSPASALKKILEVVTQSVSQGRPEESFRRSYDLPATRFAYNSFEVSFSIPNSDQLDLQTSPIDTYAQSAHVLESGLSWLVERSGNEPEISILEALRDLTPPTHGQVESAEIRGQLIKNNQVIRLNRHHRKFISETLARHLTQKHQLVKTSGQIRELDKDNLTFILRGRPNGEAELKCAFNDSLYDDVVEHFASEVNISVTGRLRQTKAVLEISDIEAIPDDAV
ncbi:hypothetical protein LOY42_17035 [Pseudomonas sp. B21-023]|uniref:hypothetical protein n=1 Tax=unclassified Pseudomonas TaxID=196821 RepID=UPI001117B0ED|nr:MULTISPECIES: hypothetical protein [unclassified Pseudomonas]UVL17606.1 hypothetical protein LOY44_16460 [Pseudomonas sp. B21-044]UVM14990.1 hypothetical protein LOY42_17035 [Pseudomonas sp. B21-023]